MTRQEAIREFGLEIVEADEAYWLELGYKINYKTNLLERV